MAIVEDMWRASRGELTVADVVRNHGFHGPCEGEVSGRVWREDPTPLRTVIEHYADVPDAEAPGRKERDKERRRLETTRQVLAALPAGRAGEHLVTMGLVDDRDDVFYLLEEELLRAPKDVSRELITARRERRALYQRLAFRETTWAGMPEVYEIAGRVEILSRA